jgi:membrane protein YqaA with SNARE-associated domain
MKLFAALYEKTIQLARHRHAPAYLGGVSFAESSFFPIPPDVMLIPMTVAKPDQWKRLALITTITSVLGGIFGYLLGVWFFDLLMPVVQEMGYGDKFELAKSWFKEWGVWVVFAAGFSPIPYKIFTFTAGALAMAFLPFVLASFIGRGLRFFLVAGLVAWFGPKMEPMIVRYIEWLGWLFVFLIVSVIIFMQFF